MVGSGEKHATVKLYWVFAVILCIVTFLEWICFKIDSIRENTLLIVPLLSAMSIVKFCMVCGWYMHLRYDDKILLKI